MYPVNTNHRVVEQTPPVPSLLASGGGMLEPARN